ncbi:hypothetical protein GCM10009802_42590 [Streptomyces synnematoformans]|uniref:Uncharacterized protein n=1 Tax=Streptomyces synnematoformans TaxID=415721 RepID=A0ABP5KQC0_9ACTN
MDGVPTDEAGAVGGGRVVAAVARVPPVVVEPAARLAAAGGLRFPAVADREDHGRHRAGATAACAPPASAVKVTASPYSARTRTAAWCC